MYYALFDLQTGCYLHSGYNAKSKKQLTEEYIDYANYDNTEFDDFRLLSKKDAINMIKMNELEIHSQKNKFPPIDYSCLSEKFKGMGLKDIWPKK